MRVRILPELLARFPHYSLRLIYAEGADQPRAAHAVEELLGEAEESLPARVGPAGVRAWPGISAWHAAFSALELPGERLLTPVEATALKVLAEGAVQRAGPAIDLAAAVALAHLVPVHVFDRTALHGDLEIGPLTARLPFTAPGAGDSVLLDAGEYAYADGRAAHTRHWIWQQDALSQPDLTATSLLYAIDGWDDADDAALDAAQAELAGYLGRYLGAEVQLERLDRSHDEATFAVPTLTILPDVAVADREGFRMAGLGYLERIGSSESAAASQDAQSEGDARYTGPVDAITALLVRGTSEVIGREALEARLRRGEPLRVKFGIDPTGPRLHLGHAVGLRKLRAFQALGHTICLVVGVFTAQIGDASDMKAVRQILSDEEIYANLATYKRQIGLVLDGGAVEWSYNNDWLGPLRLKDVIGLAAHFTVAQLLEREDFAQRLRSNTPIGLQEFLYPLMQGFDSVALKADLEIGGTEQLFNLTAGRVLQQAYGQRPQAAITCALLLGGDGQKMSKSANNCIYLDEPPKSMLAALMALPDAQILPYFELCTDIPPAELLEIRELLRTGEGVLALKKRLASEIVRLYHGGTAAQRALLAFEREEQRRERPDGIAEIVVPPDQPFTLPDLLFFLDLAASKADARRKASEGAVRIDQEVVTDCAAILRLRDGMLVQVGRRRYARVRLPT